MKIGFLSRWNATCGVSMHAELIGRELLRKGHEVKVFAPYKESANKWWHHRIVKDDEDFVVRCYYELDPKTMDGGGIDEKKILDEDFDVLIVESYNSIPYRDVEEIAKKLKGEGRSVTLVVHEGAKEDMRYSSLDIFDATFVFDERYVKMLSGYGGNIHVIPYPCHPPSPSKREFSKDDLIFFSFGRQPPKEYDDFIKALDDLESKYDFTYRIVRSDGLLPIERKWLVQHQVRLKDNEEVYDYLHMSDIHLLPKGNTRKVVVSSTLCQCIGSLVPTVVPNTRHFEMLPDEKPVVIYKDVEDLERKISMIIENDGYREKLKIAAARYAGENSSSRIADKFLQVLRKVTV
ncbi:MAG: glycosyltransferase family 1 protein [Thermoplasmata archaeon]|nr:MAG: glycosyltransferase family 1 protein [Thermoplasmata archaeon]